MDICTKGYATYGYATFAYLQVGTYGYATYGYTQLGTYGNLNLWIALNKRSLIFALGIFCAYWIGPGCQLNKGLIHQVYTCDREKKRTYRDWQSTSFLSVILSYDSQPAIALFFVFLYLLLHTS